MDAAHTLCYLIDPTTHNILNSYEFDVGFKKQLIIFENITTNAIDSCEIRRSFSLIPETLMVKFHLTAPPSAKTLLSCYSGGTSEVRNMLAKAPPIIRNRSISLAIAPSAIIANTLCYKSINYASEADLVPKFAAMMTPDLKNQLIYLKPHTDASKLNDHDWDSLTYQPLVQYTVNSYIRDF